MRYIQLLSSVLVLCFVLTVSAYAAEPATVDPPANIPEDVPEWALRPALEPGEEPTDETDTGTADDSASERGYTTIYNSDGTIRYTDDPALLADPSLFAAVDETDSSLFLSKSFDEYTVTEGFRLLLVGVENHQGGVLVASVVAEFFQITGVDAVPPTNMAELIPYLLTVFISIVLVVAVFRIVGAIAAALINWRRF